MKWTKRKTAKRRVSLRREQRLHQHTYQALEPKRCLSGDVGTVIANYRADFPSGDAQPKQGWSYQWNAPARWQPVVSNGRVTTGRLDHPTTVYRDLEFAGNPNQWTIDGDLNSNNSFPARALALNRIGGHPGMVGVNGTGTNLHDRFVIAAYTVNESAVYELTDTFIQSMDSKSDGLEIRVFVNRRAAVESRTVAGGQREYFDTELGFLRTGDTIYVAAGGRNNPAYDSFRWDFNVVKHEDRLGRVGNFRNDVVEAPGTTNWSFLWNAPDGWTSSTRGNLTSNPIGRPENYQPLAKRTSSWNVPGSTSTTAPSYSLRFNQNGGHPGVGYSSNATVKDRYAIAAFKVGVGGNYVINDSLISVLDKRSDGVEIIVHVDDGPRINRLPIVANANRTLSFDMDLGELSAGSTVYVAFGAANNMNYDSFVMDFSIDRVFPRELPLRSIPTPAANIFYVRDFGAIPNDGKNDWFGINEALKHLKTFDGPAELRFSQGTYNLRPTTELANESVYFRANGLKDVTINGMFSEIIVDDYERGLFTFQRSENVVVKQLKIDFATPTAAGLRPKTFTQGIIENVDPTTRSITLKVDTSKFLAPDSTFTTGRNGVRGWGYAVDSKIAGRLKFGAELGHGTGTVTKIDGDSYRIQLSTTANLSAGDRYVLHRRVNTAAIGIYSQSRQVSVIGVTAYSTPSTFVSANNSEAINVINSQVAIRPGSGRWKSANADGVHVQSNRVGPWVENSSFNGLSDDVMNFYTLPSTVLKIHSAKSFTLAGVVTNQLAPLSVDSFRINDRLTFIDPVGGGVLNEVRITSVTATKTKSDNSSKILDTVMITVDQPVRGVVPGRAPSGDSAAYRTETSVFNSDLSKSFLVQGNTLSNSRRYGNFLMASRGEITNNRYFGLSDQAINGANETAWPLGLHAKDVTVRENTFTANGFSKHYLESPFTRATIDFRMDRYPDLLVSRNDFQLSNIKIINNRIDAWQSAAIAIRNTDEAEVIGNKIYQPRSASRGAVAVLVDWTQSTRLVDNQKFGDSLLYGDRSNNLGLRYS